MFPFLTRKKPVITNQITFWSRGLGTSGRWAIRRKAFPIGHSNAGCSLYIVQCKVDQWKFGSDFAKLFQMIGDGWMETAVGDKFFPLISVAFITGAFFKVASHIIFCLSYHMLPLIIWVISYGVSYASCLYHRCPFQSCLSYKLQILAMYAHKFMSTVPRNHSKL